MRTVCIQSCCYKCKEIFITCPGSYRHWKVLEFCCSEFQALENPGKIHRSWKVFIINQQFWNF